MWEGDDLDDVGSSANDRRWECLIHLKKLLSEGEIKLEQLVTEVEKPKAGDAAGHPLDHGFLKKSKRSPRKKKIMIQPVVLVEVDTTAKIGKESTLKVKTNLGKYPTVVCTQESVFKKITFNKPIDKALETSTASESVKNLDRNPLSTCKRRMDFEYEEGTSDKRSKKRTEIMIFSHSGPILPEAFKNHILDTGGCLESVVLVVEKGLYKTDVSKSHGRLSIPYGQVKNQFMKSSEVDQLDSKKGEILATLVQPCLEECQISLKNWKSNSMYALVGGWNEVCGRNALRQGMIIQLWSFRRNSALCLALVQIG